MMQFSAQQVEQMGALHAQDFVVRAIQHLRTEFAAWVSASDDSALAVRVERATHLAASFGLHNEDEIICILDAGVVARNEYFLDSPTYRPLRALMLDSKVSAQDRAHQALLVVMQRYAMAFEAR
jgi:hypothetical protein